LCNWCIALEVNLIHIKASLREIVEVTTDHFESLSAISYRGAQERCAHCCRRIQRRVPAHSSCAEYEA
jgi:hypothetical protein